MYICICNALTEADLRRAIGHDSADRPAAVFAACRCRAQCGTCVRAICALLGRGEDGHQLPSPGALSVA
jgi:bacterioferritin-associated ferredoxin